MASPEPGFFRKAGEGQVMAQEGSRCRVGSSGSSGARILMEYSCGDGVSSPPAPASHRCRRERGGSIRKIPQKPCCALGGDLEGSPIPAPSPPALGWMSHRRGSAIPPSALPEPSPAGLGEGRSRDGKGEVFGIGQGSPSLGKGRVGIGKGLGIGMSHWEAAPELLGWLSLLLHPAPSLLPSTC